MGQDREATGPGGGEPAAEVESILAPYTLPRLRYGYAALEPVIDEATLRLQHGVIHRAYVERVNAALARRPPWQGKTIEDVLRGLHEIPEDIREEVRYEGGGHANHQFFWKVVAPPGGPGPSGDLLAALDRDFGSVEAFKRQFESAAMNQRGSGWAFLVVRSRRNDRLDVMTLPNNDSVLWAPEPSPGLLICDLWEHAYHANYPGRRAEWLRRWWEVVDWPTVERRLQGVLQGARRL